jgi:hypothetical protein
VDLPIDVELNLRWDLGLNPQELTARLETEKKFHIQRALSEACYWGRGVEPNQKKPSDQTWIKVFSTGRATVEEVGRFFVTYQIHRSSWQFEKVAIVANALCSVSNWSTPEEIEKLAKSLPETIQSGDDNKSGQHSHRTSAASKIAMFARPGDDVFIWDRLATVAMGVRTGTSKGATKALKYSASGPNGYQAFHADCSLALANELKCKEFASAVDDFMHYTGFTRAGRYNTPLADRGYFERRLFDKLLFCEGVRIEELRDAGK